MPYNMKYTCQKCGTQFRLKKQFENHLVSKFDCTLLSHDSQVMEIVQKLFTSLETDVDIIEEMFKNIDAIDTNNVEKAVEEIRIKKFMIIKILKTMNTRLTKINNLKTNHSDYMKQEIRSYVDEFANEYSTLYKTFLKRIAT